MKATICLFLLLLSPFAVGGEGAPTLDSLDPTALSSKQGCLAECEALFAGCRQQCEETKARAHEEHFDEPDVSVPACLQGCEEYLSICKEDC